ncbi:MAG: N,N-dimethylformamidase beta subunit family domain-containing protein, partial [Acidimicrobiales bacterium]
ESSAIIAENRLPGTTSWKISGTVSPTLIQGFASLTYAKQGQNVTLYVDSRVADYRAVAYRMGWYQGLGAREIWASPVEHAVAQPACSLATSTNMVSCANWHPSLVMPVTDAFVPGDYLIKLTAGAHAASYVLLTVWDPSSTAAYVIMNRSMIEEAWNTYGGYSFYSGEGPCIIDDVSYPPCNRARVVSFDRPYDIDYGASDFLTNEYPLIQLMEREGLDVTYISDVTLSQYPGLLVRHKVLLTLDHDEGWTYSMRVAVQDAVARGVNIVYFGAAAMVRHDRLQPSVLGPNREVVDYRDGEEDPLNGVGNPMQVTGNTWEDPPADWSPLTQIGEEYSGYLTPGVSAPMVISDASSWVFQGTGLHNGSSVAGVIESDFDHVISGSPPNVQILAHSPIPAGDATVSGETWNGVSYSDMIYFTNQTSHAGVIDTGNNVWIGDLRPCSQAPCAEPTVAKITNNILRAFGQGPTGLAHPSLPNVGLISPYDS